MTRSLNCVAGCLVVVLCMTATTTVRADPPRTSSAYLEIVRAYADALIAHGRDEYGNTH